MTKTKKKKKRKFIFWHLNLRLQAKIWNIYFLAIICAEIHKPNGTRKLIEIDVLIGFLCFYYHAQSPHKIIIHFH